MDRIALVIGNSDYSNVGKLNNPKNDADDIASILNKLNFDVTKIMDANLIDIQKSVNDFLQALDEYAFCNVLRRLWQVRFYQYRQFRKEKHDGFPQAWYIILLVLYLFR